MLRIRYFLNLTVCFSIFSLTTVLWSQPEDWIPTPNPSSGTFLGQATIDGVPAEEGDWSAAFDEDGNCAGAKALTINAGTAYINMPIYGDDNTTDEDEGMNAGESFILKVWDSSADAILEYPTSFDCWYNNNGAPMDGCGDFAEVYNFHVPPVDPNFSATLYVTSGDGTDSTVANYDLTFGFSPDATDGYDEGIDSYAPPAPPPPAFDAALSWDGDRYYTQILNGSADDLVEHEYDIALAYGSDNLITITWDNTGWSDMMSSCVLQDAFGGLLGIDIDMTQEDTLTLDNPAFNALKLKVTPLGVAYFSPSAFFTYSPEFPLTGDTLTFSDASIAGSSDIVSWSWDFDGDGAEDTTGAGPHTYVYDADSTYSATLTVTDNDLSDSYTASVTVAPPEDPTADFTYIANELTVSFTDGSQAGSGAITDWSWVFGDDSISTVQNPTHTYPSYNTYSVSLTVTNQYDLQDTKTVNVAVLGGLVIGPFTFYPNPSSGVFLGQVTIDGAPADSGSVIAAFDSASPEPNCAGAAEIIINAGLAYINFPIYGDDTTTDEDDGMNAGESFTLKLWDSSTGTILEYPESFDCWYNNNGAPMSDCGGVTEQYNFETSAPQPPVADFSGDPRSGDVPLIVQFTDESTSGTNPIAAWSWIFDVESELPIPPGSPDPNPTYTYTDPGVYTVRLTVTDESDTLESSITKESYIIVGTDENDAPVANDINVTILEDTNILMAELYAENSFDADEGDSLTFFASGAEHGTLPDSGMVYAPNTDYYGSDSFTYTVTDTSGLSDEGTVFVIIIPDGTDPPVAVIDVEDMLPGDGFVETTEDVTLNGWGSWDPDDCPTGEGCPPFQGSFEWSTVYPPGFTLQIPGNGYASFDAPEVTEDTVMFMFSLQVTDGQYWSVPPDLVTIPIINNNAPVLAPIGTQYTTEASLSIDLSATDYQENDPLTFSATSSDPDNVTVGVGTASFENDTTTAVLTLSFTEQWSGSAFVTVFVCDEVPSHCDSETFAVLVEQLGVDDIVGLPEIFALRQNYPNPFNPVTTIAYDIPKITKVRIDMYNILGQKVRTLVNGTHQPGVYHIRWNGTNDFGNPVSSGMYFYRISSEEFISVKKLVLMK